MTDKELSDLVAKKVAERGIVTIQTSDGYVVAVSAAVARALYGQVDGQPDAEYAMVVLRRDDIPLTAEELTYCDVINPKNKA